MALLTPQEQLQSRLADPKTVESLNRLLDQADLIAFSFQALDGFLRRSEVVAESLSASLTELRGLAPAANGAEQLVERLPQLARAGVQLADVMEKREFQNLVNSGLIEQLGDPKTIDALQRLLGKLDLAAFALEAADGFIRRGDEITDSIAESLGELKNVQTGIDFEKLKVLAAEVPGLIDTGVSLVQAGMPAKLERLADVGIKLADAGMLEPKVLDVLSEAGQAIAESYAEVKKNPPEPLGIFGLLRALKDPDVSRTLTFLLDVAKRYSQKMK